MITIEAGEKKLRYVTLMVARNRRIFLYVYVGYKKFITNKSRNFTIFFHARNIKKKKKRLIYLNVLHIRDKQ